MSTVTPHDRICSLGRLSVSPTVIAGLLQADSALARGREQGYGCSEFHLLRAISELHRAICAIDHPNGLCGTLLSRWDQLAGEFCEFGGLAQNPWSAAGAIESLLWNVLLSVEKFVGRRPDGNPGAGARLPRQPERKVTGAGREARQDRMVNRPSTTEPDPHEAGAR